LDTPPLYVINTVYGKRYTRRFFKSTFSKLTGNVMLCNSGAPPWLGVTTPYELHHENDSSGHALIKRKSTTACFIFVQC